MKAALILLLVFSISVAPGQAQSTAPAPDTPHSQTTSRGGGHLESGSMENTAPTVGAPIVDTLGSRPGSSRPITLFERYPVLGALMGIAMSLLIAGAVFAFAQARREM